MLSRSRMARIIRTQSLMLYVTHTHTTHRTFDIVSCVYVSRRYISIASKVCIFTFKSEYSTQNYSAHALKFEPNWPDNDAQGPLFFSIQTAAVVRCMLCTILSVDINNSHENVPFAVI